MSEQSIAIIFPGGLGDLLLLSPALLVLRERYPDARICLIVEQRAYPGAVELFSTRFELQAFDFKARRNLQYCFGLLNLIRGYQTVISSGQSPLIALLLCLSGARRRISYQSGLRFLLTDQIEYKPNTYMAQTFGSLLEPLTGPVQHQLSERIFIEELTREIGEQYILIHPGISAIAQAKGILKSPQPKFWAELIQQLSSKYSEHQIILLGGPDDDRLVREIDQQVQSIDNYQLYSESLTVHQLAGLIRYAELFYCVDSAPMHLAVALEAELKVFFGPTDHQILLPMQYHQSVVRVVGLYCAPCLWARRTQSCARPLCIELLAGATE